MEPHDVDDVDNNTMVRYSSSSDTTLRPSAHRYTEDGDDGTLMAPHLRGRGGGGGTLKDSRLNSNNSMLAEDLGTMVINADTEEEEEEDEDSTMKSALFVGVYLFEKYLVS